MKRADRYLFNALVNKIVQTDAKAESCGICHPPCLTYNVKLFGKTFIVEFISGDEIAVIYTNRSIKYSDMTIDLREIKYYNEKEGN